MSTKWVIYLSGEIHTDWREQLMVGTSEAELDISWYSPITDHENSDECGKAILGMESSPVWLDNKSAKINAIRTRTLIEKSDIVIVRFGEKYRQWNAAFDAGFAAALGKPLITMHDPELTHALKEIDAAALATAQNPAQVVQILDYISTGRLNNHK